jgi:hypothetical protein
MGRKMSSMDQVKLAKGLGWMGIGFGLTEMLAPQWLAGQIGVTENRNTLIRAMGAREVATGVAVLMQDRPTTGMRARVAGDAMDISLLAAALRSPRNEKSHVLRALAMTLGATQMDAMCARRLQTASAKLPAPSAAWNRSTK